MSTSYSSLCDDFFLDMHVNTELDLPTERDTVLTFFERIQKQYPSMAGFFRRDNDNFCLEEDRKSGRYRWISLEKDRIGSGVVNPESFEDAWSQSRLVLELIPYMLSVSPLDIDALDVTFGMDFDYYGNHDEVISEALFGSTALNCLLDLPQAKAIDFSPGVVISLSEDCRSQARISVESKTSVYEPDRTKQSSDEAISLSFTIRQYPSPEGRFDSLKSFEDQCRIANELMAGKIVPNFVLPLTNVIAQKRST